MKKKYIDEQYIVTTLIEKSFKNNKLVQAYMISSEDINYALDFAKDFAKDLICINKNESERKIIENQIDKNIYNELKIIEPINDIIKKDQFLSIKEYLNNKAVTGDKVIYIIKNCEKMNKKTANSMLKFVEEACDDLIAIFITDNIDLVIPTIVSRCQILNLNNTSKITLNNIVNNDELFSDYINNTLSFINYFDKNGINTFYKTRQLISDVFKTNEDLKIFLNLLLYFYYDVFNYITLSKIKYYNEYSDDVINVSNNLDINKVISIISVLEKNISNNYYNINQKLLVDNLVLELSEV